MGREDRIAPPTGVDVERHDDVAVLKIMPPASGALTAPLRQDLRRVLDEMGSDASIQAMVLTGGRGNFGAGTSLERGSDENGAPDLAALCDAVEAMDKPVIAAVNGSALGNGLELALSAHFRLVSPSSRLGAPEITIGLVPNGGGTQRLPKLVGGLAALKMLLSGRSVNGASAVKLGLADHLVESNLIESAVLFARDVAATREALPKTSERRDRLGEGRAFLDAVAQYKAAAQRAGLEAPLRLIECVEASLLLPFDIGRGLEAAAFEDLVQSPEAQALRYVVAAERRLQARTAEIGRVPSRPLRSVGILAARGLGNEVAVAALDAGFSVTVAERTDEALEAGVTRIIEHYDARVAAGRMSEDAVEATLDRMHAVCGYRTLQDVDIVVDPGPSIARARVEEIDAVLKAGAIFATGSEHVDLARIAESTGRPADVVGLKVYPGIMKNRVVEFRVLESTSPRATETARAFARKLGRLIVDVGPGQRGIGARLTDALHAGADALVLEGAGIEQVDDALRQWGLPLGSFAWRDAVGLERAPRERDAATLDARLASAGRTGRSAGRGFYSYERRGRPGVVDPTVTALIEEVRSERDLAPRRFSQRDIQQAVISAMAGAGAEMLTDGTAHRPSDIDMVAVHALSFARKSGGPMFAANLVGLKKVRSILLHLSRHERRILPPVSMFDDLIRVGKSFSDLED